MDLVNDRIYIDPPIAALLGLPSEGLPVTHDEWQKLAHPDDIPASISAFHAHVSGGAPYYETKLRMRHRDGHYLNMTAKGMIVARDSAGRPLWFIGTAKSLPDRR
jgi:PAS domain-containing protein